MSGVGGRVIGWATSNAVKIAIGGGLGAGSAVALNMVDKDNSSSRKVVKYGAWTTAGSGAAWGVGELLSRSSDSSRAVVILGAFGRATLPYATGVTAGSAIVKLID
jgi:hypothetical protein